MPDGSRIAFLSGRGGGPSQLYVMRLDGGDPAVVTSLKSGAGQYHFTGTPEQLADHILTWQDAGAVDGFTIMGSTLPYELTAFVDSVVPLLQRKGRFRTEYSGATLRDHLGLPRPEAGSRR